MSYYVFGSSISYQDYLQARSFSQDSTSATRDAGRRVSMDISRQTQEVISSNEALAREGIAVMEASTERLSGALKDGFSQLSYGLQDI